MLRNTRYGWILVALGAMLWGTDISLRSPLVKAGIAPTLIVLVEHLVLSVLFLPTLIKRRAAWQRLTRWEWAGMTYIACAGSAVATVLLTKAYALGSPLTATLLQKTQPILAVTLGGMLLGERRAGLFPLFFTGAMVGAYLISFGALSPAQALQSPRLGAVLCALGAAALWGSCTVVGRYLLKDIGPEVVAGGRYLLALPLLILISLPGWSTARFPVFVQVKSLENLAGIVLLPDILGMVLYYIGLSKTPASVATLAEMAYPLTALALGLTAGHQKLSAVQWAGFFVLLGCLQAIQWLQVVRTSAPLPMESYTTDSPAPLQEV